MFRKKVSEVLRDLDLSKKDYDFIVSQWGDSKCKIFAYGGVINYYELYNYKRGSLIEYDANVFQNGEVKSITNMNPFEEAVVIFHRRLEPECYLKIYSFYPSAFEDFIILKNLEDIKPNFEHYTVMYLDGTKVESFEELKNRKSFIAISKQTFYGETNYGIFREDHPIHMILRWDPCNIRFD